MFFSKINDHFIIFNLTINTLTNFSNSRIPWNRIDFIYLTALIQFIRNGVFTTTTTNYKYFHIF